MITFGHAFRFEYRKVQTVAFHTEGNSYLFYDDYCKRDYGFDRRVWGILCASEGIREKLVGKELLNW